MGQQQGFLLMANEQVREPGFGPRPRSCTANPEDARGNHPFEGQEYETG